MTRRWELSPASFDCLLRALAPDRERAAAEYEALHARLIKFFEWRACPEPEELADRTLDRLAQRLEGGAQIDQIYSYCCGVARLLMLEAKRAREHEATVASQIPLSQAGPGRGEATVFAALQECLERLPARSRRLVLGYYEEDRLAKSKHRKSLAGRLGIPLSTLRLRAFRVRAWLEKCVAESIDRGNGPTKSVVQK
jgi:DNA-directed RNA polymerase specialized sigma24 family protein